MITTKKELQEVLAYEKAQYRNYMYPTSMRWLIGRLRHEPIIQIWKWQKASRKAGYYDYRTHNGGSILDKLLYIWWTRVANKRGHRLGIEVNVINAERGFFLYHYGATVINSGSKIGRNCHFHGNNCVGNAGPHDFRCPVIGNNVMVGVGAKIIGNVHIADNVKIAAGAVVVKDILEPGCTVAGIPAKIVK